MEKGVLYLVLASLVLALILSQACGNKTSLEQTSKQEFAQDPTTQIYTNMEIVDQAIKTNNPSLCNQIEDQGYKEQCIKLVSESQK